MPLAATEFADEKAGVNDHPGDENREEDDAEEKQDAETPVEDDPANVERDREGNQADAKAEEKDDRPAAARDAHSFRLILQQPCESHRSRGRTNKNKTTENAALNRVFVVEVVLEPTLVAAYCTFAQSRRDHSSVGCSDEALFQFREPYALDIPSQTQLFQSPDAVPVRVDLVPLEAMSGGCGMSVMIVVPALAEGYQCDPPTVGGKIAGGETAGAPGVRRRIHQPSGVQSEYGAEKRSPQ